MTTPAGAANDMNLLKAKTIKGKLSLVSLITTCVALFIIATVFAVYEILSSMSSLVDSLTVQAMMIGDNSTVALSFDNRKDAAEILSALSASKNIVQAAIYTKNGKVFATYFRSGERDLMLPPAPSEEASTFDFNGLHLFRPILQDGERIGFIYIQSDLHDLYSHLAWDAMIALAAFATAIMVAFLLLSRLQKTITKPILDLVLLTRNISNNRDYSVRSTVLQSDETGMLAAGFNEMLTQIQARDQELDQYGRQLEEKVELRTAELAQANERLLHELAERKLTEEQLRHSQKMEAVGMLAGGIAHDFNNILTAIMGYGTLMQMKMKADDPLLHNVEEILAASQRAASLTQGLLAFSRKQVINAMPVDLNLLIERISKLLKRMIGEDIALTLNLAKTDIIVNADSSQIDQVMMNLATNARDSMPRGGTLQIETRRVDLDERYILTHPYMKAGPYALIVVSDTGEGMDAKTLERIFEPFYTTKEVGRGSGLGMSIVFGIIKQHNGYINAYSERGTGTTFKIYIPLTGAISTQATPMNRTVRMKGGTEVILLAEDDATIRRMMTAILKDVGYTIIEAADGEDALEKIRAEKDRIQFLILDVIMPKKNGKKVYNEAIKLIPGIKVLFVSGYTADIIQEKGIINEGQDLMLKPVAPDELLEKIRELIDK
jgi:signal transduction histidine kinase